MVVEHEHSTNGSGLGCRNPWPDISNNTAYRCTSRSPRLRLLASSHVSRSTRAKRPCQCGVSPLLCHWRGRIRVCMHGYTQRRHGDPCSLTCSRCRSSVVGCSSSITTVHSHLNHGLPVRRGLFFFARLCYPFQCVCCCCLNTSTPPRAAHSTRMRIVSSSISARGATAGASTAFNGANKALT